MGAAKKSPDVLADCLMAWSRGEDDVNAKAGARVVAEFVVLVRSYLTNGR